MANSSPENFEYIARLKFASKLRYSTQHAPELLLGKTTFITRRPSISWPVTK